MGPTLYTLLKQGERMEGGVMAAPPEMGDAPSHWMIYITVEGCDATVEKAKSLGGKVCLPPTDLPEIGRFSVLMDPQGAAFSVIELVKPA